MNKLSVFKYKHVVHDNIKLVEKLSKLTCLRKNLVQNVIRFVKCLVKPSSGQIDKEIFAVVLSKYFELIDHVFVQKSYDKVVRDRPDYAMTPEDFATIICIFLTDDVDLKVDYVFGVYDSNNDGILDFTELSENIKSCRCVTDVDEADRDETFIDLIAFSSECIGITADGINLDSFRAKVKQNVLFLTILGQVLPSEGVVERFKQSIAGKSNLQMKSMFSHVRSELLFEIPTNNEFKYYSLRLDLP